MKKELFELKRNMRIELCNITKITGYIVDNDRNCRLEFVKNFLNLEETEIFKYLDIFKKVLSGKSGRNMFQLDFKEKMPLRHICVVTGENSLISLAGRKLLNLFDEMAESS